MESRKKLKDEQMRSVLFEYYESKGKRLRFFEEFCIGRKTRTDALLVTESEIIGFEFKSDKDNLNRLERQIHDYERVCDRNYLVTGLKFKKKPRKKFRSIGVSTLFIWMMTKPFS